MSKFYSNFVSVCGCVRGCVQVYKRVCQGCIKGVSQFFLNI